MKNAGDMNDAALVPARAKSASAHPIITMRVPGKCMLKVFLGASIFIWFMPASVSRSREIK